MSEFLEWHQTPVVHRLVFLTKQSSCLVNQCLVSLVLLPLSVPSSRVEHCTYSTNYLWFLTGGSDADYWQVDGWDPILPPFGIIIHSWWIPHISSWIICTPRCLKKAVGFFIQQSDVCHWDCYCILVGGDCCGQLLDPLAMRNCLFLPYILPVLLWLGGSFLTLPLGTNGWFTRKHPVCSPVFCFPGVYIQ